MGKYSKALMLGAVMAAGLIASEAQAAEASFVEVPTAWRLEDYMNGIVAAYFTDSQCAQGQIVLPASVNTETKNRFWSLVMTAKIARKSIGIFYDTTTCNVTHFYLAEETS
jgi:hypothetical protein